MVARFSGENYGSVASYSVVVVNAPCGECCNFGVEVSSQMFPHCGHPQKLNELPRCPTLPVLCLYPDLTRTPDLDKHPSS